MKRPFDISGKVVIVTGGLGRLGRYLVRDLLKEGARVAVFDIAASPPRFHRFVGGRRRPKNFGVFQADVTDRHALESALRSVRRRWGSPEGLVNCAVLDSPPDSPAEANGPFENYPESEWDRVMAVNAKGVFLTCQVVGRAMAQAGRGSIINVNSIYGTVSPDQRIYAYRAKNGEKFFKPAAYSASKSALFNLTRYLATYWAAKGVRVNTLTLGGIFDHQDKKFLAGYRARVPLGRMAKPGEYAGAVVFLLSSASSYMTGADVVVDGGWTAW